MDLDKIVTNFSINIGNITVDCGDSTADIKCTDTTGDGEIAPASGGTGTRITHYDKTQPYATNYGTRDCNGLEWQVTDSNDAGNVAKRCGLTSDGRFYNFINLDSGTGCTSVVVHIKNETYNPYLTANFTSEIYETLSISRTAWVDSIKLWTYDLGYSFAQTLAGEWVYYTNPSRLSTNNQLHHYYSSDKLDIDNTNKVICGIIDDDLWTSSDITSINSPDTTNHEIYCHNQTSTMRNQSQPHGEFEYAVVKFINNSVGWWDMNIDFYFARMTSGFEFITDVSHYPQNPMPNTTVTISWKTNGNANGSIFWRAKPSTSNINISNIAWSMQEDTTLTQFHNISIDNTDILAGYVYQYYVQSGLSTDNNSDIYYNFTVIGGVPHYDYDDILRPYENETLKPAPVFYNATTHLAENMGVDRIDIVYMTTVLILIILSIGGLWFSRNPVLGLAIFVTAGIVFSIFNWLPSYFFTIISVVFAFLLARLLASSIAG